MFAVKRALVASILSSCIQKQPERFYHIANVCAKRYLLNYFSKGQAPDLNIFRFSEMCSRENPVSESSLLTIPCISAEEIQPNYLITPYLEAIDESICRIVISNQLKIDLKTMDILTKVFASSEKRNIHALIMLQLAKSLGGISTHQSLFAEVIELTNFGGILHSNIQENLTSLSFIHKLIGNKGMILGGDYMISSASIQCCKINSIPLIQLLCVIIQNYARGALIKPSGNTPKDRLNSYCQNSFYRSVSLLANGCQGIAFLAGKSSEACFDYGVHMGMALKAIADIEEHKEGNGKFWGFPALLSSVENEESIEDDIERWDGLRRARKLAYMHVMAAVEAARTFAESDELEKLAKGLLVKLN